MLAAVTAAKQPLKDAGPKQSPCLVPYFSPTLSSWRLSNDPASLITLPACPTYYPPASTAPEAPAAPPAEAGHYDILLEATSRQPGQGCSLDVVSRSGAAGWAIMTASFGPSPQHGLPAALIRHLNRDLRSWRTACPQVRHPPTHGSSGSALAAHLVQVAASE
jgi:hypothetical protein